MSINTGGPAFPAPAGVQHITEQGMTLRDWMAGMAMQGLHANSNESVCDMGWGEIAKYAYAQADAMLKAREVSIAMDKETVIALARQCGYWSGETIEMNDVGIERFAALVAAHEREACAQIAKQWDTDHPSSNFGGCIAAAIRSRTCP